MDIRILIAAGAILFSGPMFAQENVAFEKPVHEAGGPFGDDGDGPPPAGVWPSEVTNGHFFDEGSYWYLGSWWVDGICSDPPPPPQGDPCALVIHLEGDYHITSLVFQGDSNDEYSIEYWDHGISGWQPVWLVPQVAGAGLSTRPEEFLDPPITTHQLRIVGVGGGNMACPSCRLLEGHLIRALRGAARLSISTARPKNVSSRPT
jgi:hypothetical protein